MRDDRWGRLTLIRKVAIKITAESEYHFLRQDTEKLRESISHEWLHFLLGEPDFMGGKAHFPALEDLELDFSDWSLGPEEPLWVSRKNVQSRKPQC